jgi:leucyl-tRNA synthetase
MILGSNGEKMSKSKGNVVNPDDMVKEFGADSLRIYEMFMGPIDAAKPWDPKGIDGSKKFLERVWRLIAESDKVQDVDNTELEKIYNVTVKKVTKDYETMNFNTAISQLMIFINAAYKADVLPKKFAEGFVKLLNPVAPHITEELWNTSLGHNGSIAYEKWPEYDEAKTIDDEINIPVQVNGKLRANVVAPMNSDEETVKQIVHANQTIINNIEGKTIVKEIYVKNKIYNIVVK